MRRGNGGQAVSCLRRSSRQVFGKNLLQLFPVVRVGRARVRWFANRGFDERPLPLGLHSFKRFVFQKSGAAERGGQMLLDLPHIQFTGDADQHLPQVQRGLLSIETLQASHQHRRNDERRIGVLKRIADQ